MISLLSCGWMFVYVSDIHHDRKPIRDTELRAFQRQQLVVGRRQICNLHVMRPV